MIINNSKDITFPLQYGLFQSPLCLSLQNMEGKVDYSGDHQAGNKEEPLAGVTWEKCHFGTRLSLLARRWDLGWAGALGLSH